MTTLDLLLEIRENLLQAMKPPAYARNRYLQESLTAADKAIKLEKGETLFEASPAECGAV